MSLTTAFSLQQALNSPVGRATLLEPEAERQLCPAGGTLCNQLARLYDAVGSELAALTGTPPDLPPRKPHRWSILTEHEHVAWPMMALSQPPVIPAGQALQIVRHLATAHIAMDMERCRQWARDRHERDGYEPLRRTLPAEAQDTWAGIIATILAVQAQHAMLHGWGVLSAYVGLHPELKAEAARQILHALMSTPQKLAQPAELAATTLWATLTVLHGGADRPAPPELTLLARALRTLPQRMEVAALPHPRRLHDHLLRLLPDLTETEFQAMAAHLYGRQEVDAETTLKHTSGLPLKRAPGQTAYWLRRAGQVQVVTVTRGADDTLEVRAWQWNL